MALPAAPCSSASQVGTLHHGWHCPLVFHEVEGDAALCCPMPMCHVHSMALLLSAPYSYAVKYAAL